jgi:hypothetical protein
MSIESSDTPEAYIIAKPAGGVDQTGEGGMAFVWQIFPDNPE